MFKYALSLTLALSPITAFAHDLSPASRWCHVGKPTVMGPDANAERSLGGATLPGAVVQYCKRAGSTTTTTGTTTPSGGDCGKFDDYAKALAYAKDYCAANYFTSVEPGDYGDVIVQVLAPNSFFSPDHHNDYSLDQGLQFVCIRCETMAAGNPGDLPPTN